MAGPIRIEYEGAVYHVTLRGNERKPIFKTDSDRERFIRGSIGGVLGVLGSDLNGTSISLKFR